MKKHLPGILLILLSCSPDTAERTANFPKSELRASWSGTRESLWVFVMAGQSNMAGRGYVEPEDTIPNSRILTINRSGELIVAKEPLHFYEPNLSGLDCGVSFARSLISNLPDSISILMIPTAVGGSAIQQWLGDSTHRNVKLLTNFREKLDIGKRLGVVKAILWHQGESDAHEETIPLYRERLGRLLTLFRKEAGSDSLPILIGELGGYSRDNGNWQWINKGIHDYATQDAHAFIIATQDLHHKGDSIHFDSRGQRVLGIRFGQEFLKHE